MQLSIGPRELGLIDRCANGALLGIITASGSVVFQVADPILYPGHRQWVLRDGIVGSVRGFSLAVMGGRVVGLSCLSAINPGPDHRLDSHTVAQLEKLLPLSDQCLLDGD